MLALVRLGRFGCLDLDRGDDGDDATAAAFLEVHRARGASVDRVVLADAHAESRLELGAALADDDLAARHGLAGEHLHAEALRVRVAAVPAGAEAFLMSHGFLTPRRST